MVPKTSIPADVPLWPSIPVGLQYFDASNDTDDFARASTPANNCDKLQATRGGAFIAPRFRTMRAGPGSMRALIKPA
jgi:hypothetical protein